MDGGGGTQKNITTPSHPSAMKKWVNMGRMVKFLTAKSDTSNYNCMFKKVFLHHQPNLIDYQKIRHSNRFTVKVLQYFNQTEGSSQNWVHKLWRFII